MTLATRLNGALARFNLAMVKRSTLTDLEAAKRSFALPLVPEIDPSRVAIDFLSAQQDRVLASQVELLQGQIANASRIIDTLDRSSVPPSTLECPLCSGRRARSDFAPFESQCIFGGGRLGRVQCPDCDVIFGPDKMLGLSAAQLANEYTIHFRAYTEAYDPADEIRAFHALGPLQGGTYLNYGCGSNTSGIEQLRASGWDVWGYEPNERGLSSDGQIVRSRSVLETMDFDGIYSNNVLEHFRDPVGELSFMRSRLRPGGAMAHATPCFEYLYEFTRFHLFFFLGRSRELLAKSAGLDLSEFSCDGEFMCAVMRPIDDLAAQVHLR